MKSTNLIVVFWFYREFRDNEYQLVVHGQCYTVHGQRYNDVSYNVPIYGELLCPSLSDTAATIILLPSLQV